MDNSIQYASMISQLDTVLDAIRVRWLKHPTEWQVQLDNLLSQRFNLMRLRDGH